MRSTARVSVWALIALVCAFPMAASNAGASANGSFHVTHDGFDKTVDFSVRQHSSTGSASGEMTFSGLASLPGEDVDGDGSGGPGGTVNVSLKVSFDCLRITGNRAAASGVVTESSVPAYLGKQVILAVEDDGEPNNVDRFSWGVYKHTDPTWTPEDAEVPGDPGWMFSWFATDAERNDDTPVSNSRSSEVTCQSFGLGAYDLLALDKGSGNIQVRP